MIKIQIPSTILQPHYQVFQLPTRENCGNHSNEFGFCINLSPFQNLRIKKKLYLYQQKKIIKKRNYRKKYHVLLSTFSLKKKKKKKMHKFKISYFPNNCFCQKKKKIILIGQKCIDPFGKLIN